MTDQKLLGGKTALVTGASGGLGEHFARVLAQAGANVIVGARRVEALEKVATEIGSACSAVSLDVTDPASIAAIEDRLSTVDILVNNAGVARGATSLEQTEKDWDAVIDTNAKGVFLMSQAVARQMQSRGCGGSIINIASILGFRQAMGVASYAASKAAVVQLTKSHALEWARFGIRVNAIAPGYFETDINAGIWETDYGKAMLKRIPQRRLGEMHELDGPLLLLASDQSSYMTGSVIEVDGGHLVSTL